MNEQQARERAEEIGRRKSYHAPTVELQVLCHQMVYEGYMAAWRDAQ